MEGKGLKKKKDFNVRIFILLKKNKGIYRPKTTLRNCHCRWQNQALVSWAVLVCGAQGWLPRAHPFHAARTSPSGHRLLLTPRAADGRTHCTLLASSSADGSGHFPLGFAMNSSLAYLNTSQH